jgi:capsular exopolysaccharide synthesis family protein
MTHHLPGGDERPLSPYRRALRRHPWIVVLVTLTALAAGIAWLQVRPAEYEATAQVLVTPVASELAPNGLPILTESVDPTRTLETASTMLISPRAAALTVERLDGAVDVADVMKSVKVEPQGDSDIVAVTATADRATLAARLANAYARSALEARRESLTEQAQAQVAALAEQRRALGDDPDPALAADLAQRSGRLQAIARGQDPNFSVLQAADVPGATTATPAWMVIALALIAGLALGTGAALALEHLDRRVRDEEELTGVWPLPVLARVPVERQRGADPAAPSAAMLESFRALQIQLEARGGRGPRVVLVTSASEGDGKTTCAIALSQALASSGHKVVLLDFDLRKGDVGDRLDAYTDLLGLLRGEAPLSSVLVRAPRTRNLKVLSAPPAGDAEVLLHSLTRRLPELISQARADADYVVIDTPPLGRVADALRLMAHVDDLLLVARPGRTNRHELAIAHETLDHLAVTPSGMILVGTPRHLRAGGYYGYDPTRPPRALMTELTAVEPRRNGDRPAPPPERVPSQAAS